MMARKLYRRKLWGGFSDGRLVVGDIDTGFGGYRGGGIVQAPSIFMNRADARREYEDVRRVEIRELPPKTTKGTT